jgi:hypothetical protein
VVHVFLHRKQIEGGMAGAKELREAEDDNKCLVCLSQFTEGDTLCILPCVHQFHAECVDGWFGADITCTYGESEKTANEGCPTCAKPAFSLINDDIDDGGGDDDGCVEQSMLDLSFFGGFGDGGRYEDALEDEDMWA